MLDQTWAAHCIKLDLQFFCCIVWTTVWGDWYERTCSLQSGILVWVGARDGFGQKGRMLSLRSHSLFLSPLPYAAVTETDKCRPILTSNVIKSQQATIPLVTLISSSCIRRATTVNGYFSNAEMSRTYQNILDLAHGCCRTPDQQLLVTEIRINWWVNT